ncbi:2680_t:CDS:1, partial [Paraglomus brasilianum]
ENVHLVKQQLCAPSSIGSKKRMFFMNQEENIILTPNCQGPSVVLYQDVFSQFLNDLNDQTLKVTAEDYKWTRELLSLMATSYSNETDRWKAFNEHFSELISYTIETSNTDGTINGIICTIPVFGKYGARIILEMQNEIGEGNNDPTIQAAVEYAKFWADEPV